MISDSREPPAGSWLEVDLDAVRRNAVAIARHAGAPLLPMVKADAYGLGVLAVVRTLEPLAPWGYGVASVREGVELRDAGVTRPLVVFTPLLPADFAAARAARITPVLGDPATIAAWVGAGDGAPWHLGVDSGMARAGARWDDLALVAELARRDPPAGACTHFHSAELPDGSVAEQEARFEEALRALPARPALLHAENSAAIVRRGAASRWSLARPGIFLYGVTPAEGAGPPVAAVATLRARVVEIRQLRDGDPVSYDATYRARGPRRIATAAVGYADGYRRALSNRGAARIDGRSAPVAGLVTMDMTMLDVTDVPCAVGDVATFIGSEAEGLDVASVARAAELSPYELLVGLRLRAGRRYTGGVA
jgi:alanine racemase